MQAAFPDSKKRDELATRCRRQLIQQALDALNTEPRDERVISCALCAAAAACQQENVEIKSDDEVLLLKKLLENQKFWKPEGESERIGWATMLAALCHEPWRDLTSLDGLRVLKAVLPNLFNSMIPDALSALWDIVILLLPHYGTGIDLSKELIKPLVNQLTDPGPGVVTRICPALLPLCARLPSEIGQDASKNILESLLECMRKLYIQHSRVELSAVSSAYMDIVQWSANSNALANLITQIYTSNQDSKRLKTINLEICQLLKRWKGETVQIIWDLLDDVIKNETINQQLIADLILALAQPETKVKTQRVSFDDVSNEPQSPKSNKEDPFYGEKVQNLIKKAINVWLERCSDPNITIALLVLLHEIIDLIDLLPKNACSTFILPILPSVTENDLSNLVELIFLILQTNSENVSKRDILDSLPFQAVIFAVNQSQTCLNDPIILEWLQTSSNVQKVYLNIAHQIVSFNDDDFDKIDLDPLKWALLSEPLLCDSKCVLDVSKLLCEAIDDNKNLYNVCEIASIACKHNPENLAPRLFRISCSTAIKENLGKDIAVNIENAWLDALRSKNEIVNLLLNELHNLISKVYDVSFVRAMILLSMSCDSVERVFLDSYLKNVEMDLVNAVAVANFINGNNTCEPKLIEKLPTKTDVISWINWRKIVGASLLTLLEQNDLEFDQKQNEIILKKVGVDILFKFSLAACFVELYTHLEYSEQLQNWVSETKKLCDNLKNLLKLTESDWWDSVPNDNVEVMSWAASTAYLASETLLPGGEITIGLRSPHILHITQACAARSLLKPERVVTFGQSSLMTRLSILAEHDSESVETVVAEGIHALKSINPKNIDIVQKIDACLLLKAALIRSSNNEKLIDLATVFLAEWAKTVTFSKNNLNSIRFMSAYCQLVATHLIGLTGNQKQEFDDLFAKDIRDAVFRSFLALVELAKTNSLFAWPLCNPVYKALVQINFGNDTLWKISLLAIETRCVPVQLCGHFALKFLCNIAREAGGQSPPHFSTKLLYLLNIENERVDTFINLSCVLAWDAASVLHASWEQPNVDIFLKRLLTLIPNEPKDDWFSLENDNNIFTECNVLKVLQRLSCQTFTRWLTEAGAASRSWWTNSNLTASERQRAEKLASKHVTRRAIRAQLTSSHLPDGVKCSMAGRLIQAECHIEDARIELKIELREAWPLGQLPPIIEAKPAPHRDKLMQITLAAAAGAPLHRLLKLWKDAVDRRYEGLDECHICFSLLYAATAQLPKLKCPTCKKSFHSACLYRWFSTSNKSTCPLCRNLF